MTGLKQLAGFPMLLAVSETAINNQFKEVSTKTHDLPTSWSLPEEPTPGEADYEEKKKEYDSAVWYFTVTKFAPPQVDFNTDVKQGCRLIMEVLEGKFSSETLVHEGGNWIPKAVDVPLNGLKIYVDTPMQQVVHSQFSDELFEVQALFADLENLSNVSLDQSGFSEDIRAKVGGPIEASIQTLVMDKLKKIGKANPNTLMFGAVKIPTVPESKKSVGVMAPQASKYSVHKVLDQHNNYLTGSLNYLLWPDTPATMPAGEAVGVFNESWVDSGQMATLVVSEAFYFKHFLIPALQLEYPNMQLNLSEGNATAGVGATASLQGECPFTIDGLDSCRYTTFDIKIQGNNIYISYVYKFRHKSMGTWDHYEATGESTITVTWQDGKLNSTVYAPKPNVENTDDSTRQWFKQFGEGVLMAWSLGIAAKAILDADDGAYDNAVGAANVINSLKTIPELCVLPGQAVFHYTSAQMDNQLRFDCSYNKVGA